MANDINSVVLCGRLTRDCGEQDFGYTQGGTARARVSVAVNRGRRQADGSWADEASFFNVSLWGKAAENLMPYLTKGRQVVVRGSLRQERWSDPQTGQSRSAVSIMADELQLVGGQGGGGDKQGYQRQPQSQSYGGQTRGCAPPPAGEPSQGGMGASGFDEDIPF